MRLLNRKKQVLHESVPEEVQSYYVAEQRSRTGTAWLLAAGTLVATVLVVMGLFYGGRAMYRAVNDDSEPTSQTDTENNDQPAAEERQTEGQANPNTANPEPVPAPAPTPTPPASQETMPRTGPDIDA